MDRAGLARIIVAAFLCLLAGCAAARKLGPAALLPGQKPAASETQEKTAQENPFRKGSNEQAKPASEEKGDSQTIAHDKETLELIARELEDADPQERKLLMESLKGLHPQMVQNILRARRMRIQLEHQRVATGPSAGSEVDYDGLGAPFPGTDRRTEDGRRVKPAGYSAPASNSADYGPLAADRPPVPFQRGAPGSVDQSAGNAAGAAVPPGGGAAERPLLWPTARNAQAAVSPNGASWSQAAQSTSPSSDQALHQTPTEAIQYAEHNRPYGAQTGPGSPSIAPLGTTGPDDQPVGLESPQFAANFEQASAWQAELEQMLTAAQEQARQAQLRWEEAESAAASGGGAQEALLRKQEHIRQQVYLRLLYLMAGQDAQALDRIAGLEPADQEFWTQMLWAIMNYFDYAEIPHAEDRATQTVAQLRSAVWRLQENARLEIRNVNFCRKISSYGNYETFPQDEFRRKQAVLIYAEIENFASEQGTDGLFRTQLKSTIEIHRAGPEGGLVKRIDFPATTDICRNHRRDYFHSYEIQIPADATLGPHVLKLIVEDELSRKVASYSRNFMVVDGR